MPNVAEESRARRQRQLADGRRSRSYTPIEDELFTTAVGYEALGFLAWIRRAANANESDGFVEDVELAGLATRLAIKPSRLRQLLQVLEGAGAIQHSPRGITDLNNACWSKTHEEREQTRLEWAQRQRRARGTGEAVVPLMSRGESRSESRGESRSDSSGSHARSHTTAKVQR